MATVEQRLGLIETTQVQANEKLDGIAEALKSIAVQNEQIKNLQSNLSVLWEKCDKAAEKMGEVEKHVAACPQEEIKKSINTQQTWLLRIGISLFILAVGTILHGVTHG